MPRQPAVVLRRADITAREHPYLQRLHPGARPFVASRLGRDAGLRGVGVSRGRLAPGEASFAYHAHTVEQEWIFVLEGRPTARIDGADVALEPGDFVAFPAPSVAHQLRNDGDREVVYLFGGDDHAVDILDYPDLGARYAITWDGRRAAFHPLGPAEHPFERLDAPTARPWRVLGLPGWGSAIAEAALAVAGVAYVREDVDMEGDRAALRAVNPLGQVPTVVLPDGGVLTETAAIVLYLAELAPESALAPPPGAPERPAFLRWLTMFVAAIYPTFTYGDDLARWTRAGGEELRAATDAYRAGLWRQLDAATTGPWLLGARFSALDLYVAVMTRWRPGRAWFDTHAPRLAAIARACDARPELAEVWRVNFPA